MDIEWYFFRRDEAHRVESAKEGMATHHSLGPVAHETAPEHERSRRAHHNPWRNITLIYALPANGVKYLSERR
jgi:hypothetical protein